MICAGLVTLLLLAVDPFVQALIAFEGRLDIVQDATASLARSEYLDVGTMWDESSIVVTYPGGDSMLKNSMVVEDILMSAALSSAFFNSSTPVYSNLPMSCNTGNCTWPAFSTLALCSSCVDVTQHVVKETVQGFPGRLCSRTTYISIFDYPRYRLPYGDGAAILDFSDKMGVVDPDHQGPCRYDTRVQTEFATRPNATIAFRDSSTLLFAMVMLKISDEFWGHMSEATFGSARVSATECAFQFCAQVIQASVTGGSYIENITEVSLERQTGSFAFVNASYSSVNNVTLDKDVVDTDLGLSLDQSFYHGNSTYRPAGPAYGIAAYPAIHRSDLQLVISAAEPAGLISRHVNVSQRSIASMQAGLRAVTTQSTITRSLDGSHNFAESFTRAARSISNHIRQADARGAVVTGMASRWAVHVRVRWSFLAFPAAVALSGAAVLVAVAAGTRRLGIEALKSDATAVVLCGLDDEGRRTLRRRRGEKTTTRNTARRGVWTAGDRDPLLKLEDCEDGMLELRLQPAG